MTDLLIDGERAERMAKKANARRAAKAPLFAHAGLLEQLSPKQIQDSFQGWWERFKQFDRVQEERAAVYKQLVKDSVTPEMFDALCQDAALRDRLDPCYRADFWHCRLKEVNLPLYQALCNCQEPEREAALRRLKVPCGICGRSME